VKTSDYLALSDTSTIKRSTGKNNFDGFDRLRAAEREAYDSLCTSRDPKKFADYPINCVDHDMAKSFCVAKGKRLPSEAEWEFAARGPDQRKYPWGDDPPGPGLLNACGSECVAWGKAHKITETGMYGSDDGFPNSAPVGSFPRGKSRYGVEDVVGNVWEWTADWFASYPPDSGSTTTENPTGPAMGTRRVIRGGAWNGADPSWVKPTLRYHDDPAHTSYGVGFRCAK
jgi:formylglycine-generating enzyme required for sulfatase activity